MMSISPEKLASATALRTISHAGKEKQPCIRMADLCRPGLQFAGYFDIFAFERPQVIGKTEMAYLDNLPAVSYTHLDVYKRQAQAVSEHDAGP